MKLTKENIKTKTAGIVFAGVMLLKTVGGVSADTRKAIPAPQYTPKYKSELESISVSSGIESMRYSNETGNPFVYGSLLDWELNSVKSELGFKWKDKNQTDRSASVWVAIPFRDGRINDNDATGVDLKVIDPSHASAFSYGSVKDSFRAGGEIDKFFKSGIDNIDFVTKHKLDYSHLKGFATGGYVKSVFDSVDWYDVDGSEVTHTDDILRYSYGVGANYTKQGKVFGFEAGAGVDMGLELSYFTLPFREDMSGIANVSLSFGAEGKVNFIVNMVNKDGKGVRLKLGGGVDVAKSIYGVGIEFLKKAADSQNLNNYANSLGFKLIGGQSSIKNSVNFGVGVDVLLGK